jgi:hypothetical protein
MEYPYCKGDLKPGRTTYRANRHGYRLLLDNILAGICVQCSKPIFEEKAVEAIQRVLMTIDKAVQLSQQKV